MGRCLSLSFVYLCLEWPNDLELCYRANTSASSSMIRPAAKAKVATPKMLPRGGKKALEKSKDLLTCDLCVGYHWNL